MFEGVCWCAPSSSPLLWMDDCFSGITFVFETIFPRRLCCCFLKFDVQQRLKIFFTISVKFILKTTCLGFKFAKIYLCLPVSKSQFIIVKIHISTALEPKASNIQTFWVCCDISANIWNWTLTKCSYFYYFGSLDL